MTSSSTSIRFDRHDRLVSADQFDDWCMLIQSVLDQEDAWEILQPGYTPPKPEHPDFPSWTRKNRIARTLLPQAVDPTLRHLLRNKLDTASVAWKAIQDHFVPDTHQGKVRALASFFHLRYSPSQTIEAYLKEYAEKVALLERLDLSMAPGFISTHLLTTLPPSFNSFKTVLFNTADPEQLPKPEVLYRRIKDEAAMLAADDDLPDKQGLAGISQPRERKSGPPSACYVCKGPHWMNDCPDKEGVAAYKANRKKKGKQARAALAVSSTTNSPAPSSPPVPAAGHLASPTTGFYGWAAHVDSFLTPGWYLDSGASHHMTGDLSMFASVTRFDRPDKIKGIGNATVDAVGAGPVYLQARKPIQLREALYAPDLRYSLLSIPKITASGASVSFSGSTATVTARDGTILAVGEKTHSGLFRLVAGPGSDEPGITAFAGVRTVTAKLPLLVWHRRLGHLHFDAIKKLAQTSLAGLVNVNTGTECESCTAGKLHRAPFPDSTSRASSPGELLHTDLLSFPDPSISKCRYLLVVVDDHSRKTWGVPLMHKSDTAASLRHLLVTLRTQGFTVQRLRSDRGGEYLNAHLAATLKELGIVQETTVGYSPQSNGRAERVNRTIVEAVRTMLIDAGLEKRLWAEAALTFVFVKNRSPHLALPDNKTPDEVFYANSTLPKVALFRAFGCQVWAYVPKENRSKLDPSGKQLIFVGYESSAAYRLYSPDTGKVRLGRVDEVLFNEDVIPLREPPLEAPPSPPSDNGEIIVNVPRDPTPPPEEPPLGRGHRVRQPANTYPASEWHCLAAHFTPALEEALAAPGRQHQSAFNFPGADYLMGLAAVNGVLEPTTYKAAMASPEADKWSEACKREIDALKTNGTWRLVDGHGKRTIGSKWVFKAKRGPDGEIMRYKARLVAQGFNQRPGIDFAASYAPVVKFTTLRLVAAVAARNGWELHTCDVDNAYLHGEKDPDDIVFMRQPEGFAEGKGLVCEVLKPLYGLKPSALYWYRALEAKLHAMGFTNTHSDRCLFVKRQDGVITIVVVYVNDLVITASDTAAIAAVKAELHSAFGIKDGGIASWILGLRVIPSPGGIHLSQERYILDCLKKYSLEDLAPITIPIQRDVELRKAQDGDARTDKPFLEALGSLMYAMLATRPDIAYAVSRLSRHSAHPTEAHWSALVDVYRYLKGTASYGIMFKAASAGTGVTWLPPLLGYSDAAHGDDVATSRSTMGYIFLVDGSALCWSSKLQSRVCRSLTEAEYLALSHACDTAVWLRQLLQELNDPTGDPDAQPPTVLYGDNMGSVALAENARDSTARRHIRITEHLVRELVDSKQVALRYTPTATMLADLLTKGLAKLCVACFRAGVGLVPAP